MRRATPTARRAKSYDTPISGARWQKASVCRKAYRADIDT
jgi:hypothetical protein